MRFLFYRNIIVFVFLFIVLSSCNKSKSKNIISEEKIVPLLVDLLLLEAKQSLVNVGTYNISNNTMDSLYLLVYEKYDTDSIAFRNTLQYYASKPDAYIEMMTAVKDKLNTIDSLTILKYGKEPTPIPQINALEAKRIIKDSLREIRKKKILENLKR